MRPDLRVLGELVAMAWAQVGKFSGGEGSRQLLGCYRAEEVGHPDKEVSECQEHL